MDENVRNESFDDADVFLNGFQNVNLFVQHLLRQTSRATQMANQLPGVGDDYDYYSCFETFRNFEHVESGRLLDMMQQILKYHGAKGNLVMEDDLDDVSEKFDTISDANDHILEKVNMHLDEAAGISKQQVQLVLATVNSKPATRAATASWNRKTPTPSDKHESSNNLLTLITGKGVVRPQTKFCKLIDNSTQVFVPKLPSKPNSQLSLQDSLQLAQGDDYGESGGYAHPYQYELDHFEPVAEQLERVQNAQVAPSLQSTPLKLVSTVDELQDVCNDLKKEKEISVDLEHHSMFSYLGITCLIQISSRTTDYIIDPFDIWEHLHLLNNVFTDPKIVKVFHGSDSDVEWLQRDFGVYVVNMFDTQQAAVLLNFPHKSLAALLSHYCQLNVDKQYQRADWRIRPLPEEFLNYAREDTHYLLYVYDRMRNDLIDQSNGERDLLAQTLERSKQLCLKRYEKPIIRHDSHLALYRRNKKLFNSRQMYALKSLYAWRDKIARVEDESTECVLPKLALLKMADNLPRDPEGVRACCSRITPLINRYLTDIHAIIKKARDLPLEQNVDLGDSFN